ncbi:MAG: DNRLRE domain-containing protein [Gemmatimonadota bacterium]
MSMDRAVDSSGNRTAGSWRIPGLLTAFTALVAAGLAGCGSDGPPTGPEPPEEPPGFQIEIRYVEGTEPTPEQRAMFEAAVARWEDVIVGDVPAVRVRQPTPFACQKLTAPAMDEEIDDIVVFVEFGPLDGKWEGFIGGTGSVLGWAGVCVLRDDFLPAVSSITLDEDDEDNFTDPLVLHELGHALGFGEVWTQLGMLKDPSDPANGRPGPLEAVADATVSEWYAEENFGLPDGRPLSEHLVVGQSFGTWTEGPGNDVLMSLIRFDVSALAAPPLAAILELTPTQTAGDTSVLIFERVLEPWQEGAVSWNSLPAYGGRIGGSSDAETGFLSTCSAPCLVDLTAAVAEWVRGTGAYGITVRQEGVFGDGGSNIAYHTRGATDPEVRPRLLLDPDTHFAGAAARAAFDALGGTVYEFAKVPVEGGYTPERVGAIDGHWRGTVFRNELMEPGGGTALSAVTIGAMEDIGYEVDHSVADPVSLRLTDFHVLPGPAPAPIDGSGGPLYRVTPRGSFELLSPRAGVPASTDADGTRRP